MKIHSLLFLFGIFLSYSANSQNSNSKDSLILIDFYNNTNVNWDISTPYRDWEGVGISYWSGDVSYFGIDSGFFWDLKGIMPKSFFRELTQMRYLNFDASYPDIIIKLPSEIKNMTLLKELIINRFPFAQGVLPPEIGELKELRILDIYQTSMTGELPSEIGNLKKLQTLYLFSNEFNGPIPDSIGNLISLEELTLGYNNFSGPLPESLGKLINLEKLTLRNEGFSGPLPESLGGLKKLARLYLENNNFSGPLPKKLSNLSELLHLNLCDNNIEGSLPEQWGNMNSIQTIDLHNNKLSGAIPDNWSNLTTLRTLELSQNNFSIEVLKNISVFKNLSSINLSGNKLIGVIPEELSEVPNLSLNLSNNQLYGLIPEKVLNSPMDLRLSYNNLDSLPVYTMLTDNRVVSVSNNRLTFDDIIPNLAIFNRLSEYVPQKPFSQDSIIIFNSCQTPLINLQIDQGITDSEYTWYKNGDSIHVSNQNKLNLRTLYPHFEEYAGLYTVKITNPNVPALTLESGEMIVELDMELPTPDTITIDTSLLYGSFLEIAGRRFDCARLDTLAPIPDPITNCITMYDIHLTCRSMTSPIVIPSAFTPDGDGINETFLIPTISDQPDLDNQLQVYNEAGKLVYQKQNYANQWRGTNEIGMPLPIGTYRYTFKMGDAPAQTGLVTIIR